MNTICKASAIIVAAGKGSRMKQGMNKQYMLLKNKPVLAHTIEAFEKVGHINEIIVVINKKDRVLFEKQIRQCHTYSKIAAVVYGGYDRQASVYNGLSVVSEDAQIVSVHDGARPLVTPEIIENAIITAMEKGVGCVGVPLKDTIKRTGKDAVVEATLDRSTLWSVQTPQVFRKDILERVHKRAAEAGFRGTDDAVLAERLGYPVHMVMGSYSNIKLTTPEDLVFAEAIMK